MMTYDVIVVGAGAAGMMAAITAARRGKAVLLLEKLSKIGAKLKATGGGRCNLTNTLSNADFMARFGREGRFMTESLHALDHKDLVEFFKEIGVESHAPDGYRIFPTSHNSTTIISALESEMSRLNIHVKCSQKVLRLNSNERITGVTTQEQTYEAPSVIIATGGMGYPQLGADGDGYEFAISVGHKIKELYPAMMPLHTKESWVKNCRADTIAKVELHVNLPKTKTLKERGDLIFTNSGIRGPLVLDFAREVTPLLKKHGEVPLLINLVKGMNEEQVQLHFKNELQKNPHQNTLELINTLLPESLCLEVCHMASIDSAVGFNKQEGKQRAAVIKLLTAMPLTVTGHDGFKMAMITRGGISLKEINPKTMQSKLIEGLYFCGEVMDLDGPCGGYNLQWSFSSGYIAGHLSENLL
ncbi:MAG: NAD(P)/FAD-dependent oxidoreductase [Campylobacterota bacterium]|nr:NAD(P)/FAD-dependent oxidoreductase [Campylobacterota bacterium]